MLNCQMLLRPNEVTLGPPQAREDVEADATAAGEQRDRTQQKKVAKKDSNWAWVLKQLLPWLEKAYGDHAITRARLLDFAMAVKQRRYARFTRWYLLADQQPGDISVPKVVSQSDGVEVALLLYHPSSTGTEARFLNS